MSGLYIRKGLLSFRSANSRYNPRMRRGRRLVCTGGGPRPAALVAPPRVELPKQIGPKQEYSAPPMLIDPSKKYKVIIEMDKDGEIVIDLHADKPPSNP